MVDTKENILLAALRLFARDGYEAVSVSAISGQLGMTKGALYKHYKNKRDIFDSIVKRMYQLDEQRARQHQVPVEDYENDPQAYEDASLEQLGDFMRGQFFFWTEDEFACNFRKMLTLEQYRNGEIAQLYHNCITRGPVAYTENLFKEMIHKGVMEDGDPKGMAVEFYAVLYLLIGMSDAHVETKHLLELLNKHIEKFVKGYKRK